jgi:hypothetical protein
MLFSVFIAFWNQILTPGQWSCPSMSDGIIGEVGVCGFGLLVCGAAASGGFREVKKNQLNMGD